MGNEKEEREGRVMGGKKGGRGEMRYIMRLPKTLLEIIGCREYITINQSMIYNKKIRKLKVLMI